MSARVQIIRKKVRFPFRNEKCVMHFLGIHSGLYDSSVILSNLATAKKIFFSVNPCDESDQFIVHLIIHF